MNELPETIRFQVTGVKHKISRLITDEPEYPLFETKCEQLCMFGKVGKVEPPPEHKDCEVCYGSTSILRLSM